MAVLDAVRSGPPLSFRAQQAVAAMARRLPDTPSRPLAEPPPGSGLKPVMGTGGLPVIGTSLEIIGDNLPLARQQLARFGELSWTYAFGIKSVSVLGPEAIGEVLANRDRAFSNEQGWSYFIGPFFRGGVMLMDFEEHRLHRRIMQQAFKHERLVTYLKEMSPAIARGIAHWGDRPELHVYTAAKQLTLDVATEVFVGDELGARADELNEAFVHSVVGGAALIRADVPGGRWRRGLRGRRLLEDYFRAQIPAKRAGRGTDLFSVLCHAETEEGERFTDEDVVNHMIFVLMAAHDTSTITLSMMAYFLGRHPEWQERLREESRALGTVELDHAAIDELESMDLVMKETLRMSAPVGALMRRAIKDTSLIGHYIPSGTYLVLGIYSSQRMEPWWHDPDRFDPERFSDSRREDAWHKYAWVPFGGGVHKCIGMHFGSIEVKAIMHQLLLRNSWRIPAGYEPVLDYGTGPYPGDGLPIELRALL
jgi:cytochrome P450